MRVFSFLLLISLLPAGCGSVKPVADKSEEKKQTEVQAAPIQNKPVNFSDPVTWILGSFKVDRLYREPYSEWFLKGFDEYVSDAQAIGKLKALITPAVAIKIVMGTWCPDSRREVPRFMRILSVIDFPADRVELIGVDNSKIAPVDNYAALDIKRVPTFIIYKNNVEAGRIIENPVTSLEQDMVNILTRNE